MKYNWTIPVRSLLCTLQKHGAHIAAVDNGDGWVPCETLDEAVEEVNATDESRVWLTFGGHHKYAYLVLGNEPAELLADYTIHPAIDAAAEEHYNNWEGKPCPTTES